MIEIEKCGILLAPSVRLGAKFNAGMVRADGQVHMLYRWAQNFEKAQSSNFRYQKNFIAHATLDLNGNLICDDDAPVISPCCEYDKAGIEDPRIVDFEGSYYIFYTCYDLKQARVGLSKTDDFIHYKRLGIVPAPSFDKDAFIFPERINHKIAYIHRIGRTIQIDYFDEMDDLFDKAFWKNYCVGRSDIMKSSYWWESSHIGGGIPPFKTKDGWIFFYHGVDLGVYCGGVALLDLQNPYKILARLPYPILEPTEEYEKSGDVNNVVFPQGSFLNGDTLYISYGAADTVVAMAKMRLSELLDELKKYPVD